MYSLSLETFTLKAVTSSVDLMSSLREFEVTAPLYAKLFFIKFVLGFGREKSPGYPLHCSHALYSFWKIVMLDT